MVSKFVPVDVHSQVHTWQVFFFCSSVVLNHNLSLPVDQKKEVVEVKRGDDVIIDCLTDSDERSVAVETVAFLPHLCESYVVHEARWFAAIFSFILDTRSFFYHQLANNMVHV